MPRQSNGIYIQPTGTAAVNLATIDPTAFNTLITDIGTEITGSLPRNGSAAAAAAIPMGGFKITGLGTPTVATDGATKAYVDALLPSGTVVVFAQAAAPTGWTQVTANNDYLLRMVSGTSGGSFTWNGGASGYGGFNGGSTAITIAQMPSHNHPGSVLNDHTHGMESGEVTAATGAGVSNLMVRGGGANFPRYTDGAGTLGLSVNAQGSGAGHQHTQAALTYMDVIICSKN